MGLPLYRKRRVCSRMRKWSLSDNSGYPRRWSPRDVQQQGQAQDPLRQADPREEDRRRAWAVDEADHRKAGAVRYQGRAQERLPRHRGAQGVRLRHPLLPEEPGGVRADSAPVQAPRAHNLIPKKNCLKKIGKRQGWNSLKLSCIGFGATTVITRNAKMPTALLAAAGVLTLSRV